MALKPLPGAALPADHLPGANNPPDIDPRLERLNESYADRIELATELEIAASRLPTIVETEEQAEQITAWIADVSRFQAEVERARKAEKEEPLKWGRIVDGFFSGLVSTFGARITTLNRRVTSYQQAKRERERIERERLARIEREAEELKRQEAAQLLAAQQEAERKAAEALDAMEQAKTAAELDEAERVAREAAREADQAQAGVDAALGDVRTAAKAADRAERQLEPDHKLERVSTAGATSTLKLLWRYRIVDRDKVRESLGLWAPYIGGEAVVLAALDRMAKAQEKAPFAVPGVEFFSEEESRTRTTRTGSRTF